MPVELFEPHEMQWIIRAWTLFLSTRIKTAPQFPHLHSTVELCPSSTGGALATASMASGAGTTLRAFCRREGMRNTMVLLVIAQFNYS